MPSRAAVRRVATRVALWALTLLLVLGIASAGAAKLVGHRWDSLFLAWGYPRWFMLLVGAAEVAGAICLLVPKLASYAACFLSIVMLGAVVTLASHPGGPLGWGKTPLVYTILLLALARVRWSAAAHPLPRARAGVI
jgi:uncharacterized membrane protein YphA (DoxX/SURF4 family)